MEFQNQNELMKKVYKLKSCTNFEEEDGGYFLQFNRNSKYIQILEEHHKKWNLGIGINKIKVPDGKNFAYIYEIFIDKF
jgi:hypothetical protein